MSDMHFACKIPAMAIGKRKRKRQETLWIPTNEIPTPPAHPFYRRLNSILEKQGFDEFVEGICAKFYDPKMGRPGLAPGIFLDWILPTPLRITPQFLGHAG